MSSIARQFDDAEQQVPGPSEPAPPELEDADLEDVRTMASAMAELLTMHQELLASQAKCLEKLKSAIAAVATARRNPPGAPRKRRGRTAVLPGLPAGEATYTHGP